MKDFSVQMALWSVGCYLFGVVIGMWAMQRWMRKSRKAREDGTRKIRAVITKRFEDKSSKSTTKPE